MTTLWAALLFVRLWYKSDHAHKLLPHRKLYILAILSTAGIKSANTSPNNLIRKIRKTKSADQIQQGAPNEGSISR